MIPGSQMSTLIGWDNSQHGQLGARAKEEGKVWYPVGRCMEKKSP